MTLKVTDRQLKKYERNLNRAPGDSKRGGEISTRRSREDYKNKLLSEHLAAVERWLGRRLTQAELLSGTFARSREMYITAGMMWKREA